MKQSPKRKLCRKVGSQLQAYYDGQLPPEKAIRVGEHIKWCESCSRKLEAYSQLSQGLRKIASDELNHLKPFSFWPAIRARLVNQTVSFKPRLGRMRLWFRPRPVWIGLTVSVVVLLIIFFSTLVIPSKLPANYCRIESISAPEHQLMIYQEKTDGFTIIWLLE